MDKTCDTPGVLYIVATPIGNLDDISRRALQVLKAVTLIAAEDTRHSRKLLAHFRLEDIVDVTAEDIEKISGFGSISSRAITRGIKQRKSVFAHLLALGFNLERTPLMETSGSQGSPIAGRGIVFTGRMRHGTRDEMHVEARRLGARVQTAVSSKTDYLVCGEKVGARKLEKAAKAGARIMTEEEYRALLELKSEN